MNRIINFSIKFFLIFTLAIFVSNKVLAEDINAILQNDIKTLEKAVYGQNLTTNSSEIETFSNDDVLTKHLLKLSELEEQFKILTNNFEEINFKLDKLSSRITKVQSDNQVRFQDLEGSNLNQDLKSDNK